MIRFQPKAKGAPKSQTAASADTVTCQPAASGTRTCHTRTLYHSRFLPCPVRLDRYLHVFLPGRFGAEPEVQR